MPFKLSDHITPGLLRRERNRYNMVRVLTNQQMFGRPVTMRYFQRLGDENFIRELCFIGWNGHEIDPNLIVDSIAPDGKTMQRWKKYVEGDLTIFRPPDGYNGGPVGLSYDRFKHWVEAMQEGPRTEYFITPTGPIPNVPNLPPSK